MTRDEVINDLKERFKEDIVDFVDKSPKRVYVRSIRNL